MDKGLHKLTKQLETVWSRLLVFVLCRQAEKFSLHGFVKNPLDERVVKQSRAEIIKDLDAKINRWVLD